MSLSLGSFHLFQSPTVDIIKFETLQDLKKEAVKKFQFKFKYFPENVADEVIQDNTMRILFKQVVMIATFVNGPYFLAIFALFEFLILRILRHSNRLVRFEKKFDLN